MHNSIILEKWHPMIYHLQALNLQIHYVNFHHEPQMSRNSWPSKLIHPVTVCTKLVTVCTKLHIQHIQTQHELGHDEDISPILSAVLNGAIKATLQFDVKCLIFTHTKTKALEAAVRFIPTPPAFSDISNTWGNSN